jgi:hypothetical protein
VFGGLSNAKRSVLAVAVGAVIGIAATTALLQISDARSTASPPPIRGLRSGWVETKWPFAVDVWSSGRAFTCGAAECGADVTLYLRARIGSCNCATGVSDDAELERMAEIHLVGGSRSADGPGRPIEVAGMKGRSRSYAIADTRPAGKSALVIAFSDRCDGVVGTAIIGLDQPLAVEPTVINFLNSQAVVRWAQASLGL